MPSTSLTAPSPAGVGWVSSKVVRRAAVFMEENADQPLTVGTIAAAVGVGPRALQHAFHRHLGATPLAHLRDLRLGKAHEQLGATAPAARTTVRQVAAAWGFGNPHRFTVAYQKRYGHHPKVTLATDPA